MTVGELAAMLAFEVLTGDVNLDRTVSSGYVSDLLSDVIANIEENSAWITVQRHVNILGVAKLKEVSAIIIPRKLQLEEEVLEKAKSEGIAVLRDQRSAFEISGLVYNALRRGRVD
jgi:predicted transcriptional regulator